MGHTKRIFFLNQVFKVEFVTILLFRVRDCAPTGPVKYTCMIWPPPPSHFQFGSISRSSLWIQPRSSDLISRTSYFHWRIRRNQTKIKQRALSVPLEHWRMDLAYRFDPQCQPLCRSSVSSSYRPLWNLLKIFSTHISAADVRPRHYLVSPSKNLILAPLPRLKMQCLCHQKFQILQTWPDLS